MTVQLYVAFKSFIANVEFVPKDVVVVPFVQLYVEGVVTTPLTLKVAFNVAVSAVQSTFVGVIVTTASGPVCPA